jgi:Zn-finger nucleic acid-binding protein
MAHCSNCSAPLPSNSIICEYCKTRNDTDLAEIHHYTTSPIESARTCPHCDIRLKTIDLQLNGTFLIERCNQCLGLFFDPQELEALLEASVSNVFDINRSKLDNINNSMISANSPVVYIKCPVCAKLMNRVNFGTKSGVVIDRCRDHGVWLDAGELRHLFEWMKAGGKLLTQERELQLKKEAERERMRQERNQLAEPVSTTWGADDCSSFDLFGSVLKNSDPDFFVLVKKAVRWFT